MPRSPKRSSLQTTYGSPAARATVGDSGTAQKESWMSSGRTGPDHVTPPSRDRANCAHRWPASTSVLASYLHVAYSGPPGERATMSGGNTCPQHSETTIPWIQVAPPSNEFPDRAASAPDPVSRQATWISPSPTAVAAGDWITRPGVVSETWTFADQEAPSVLDREW